MSGPNTFLDPILLFIAGFAYVCRHDRDPPFRDQWYRGCGRNPLAQRGPLRNVSGETNG